jgi:hypothetical protein
VRLGRIEFPLESVARLWTPKNCPFRGPHRQTTSTPRRARGDVDLRSTPLAA